MVEGGMKCVKYLVFFFNLIFFIVGLCLIITAAVVMTKFKDVGQEILGSAFNGGAIVLIVTGAIIFIIGFCGCCGAYKENHTMLLIFAWLLVLVFVLEIAAGIAAFVMKGKVEEEVKTFMDDRIKDYPDHKGVRETWDYIQEKFECCGADNTSDWNAASLGNGTVVPKSCCKDSGCTGTQGDVDQGKIFNKGCFQGTVDYLKDNIIIVGGVGIGFAVIQLFGICLSCMLARFIKKEYEVV